MEEKRRHAGKAAAGTPLQLSRVVQTTQLPGSINCLLWSHNFKVKIEDTHIYRRRDDCFSISFISYFLEKT